MFPLALIIYVRKYYKGFKPNISLASFGLAISLPNSFARRTTFATSSPLLFANTPFER